MNDFQVIISLITVGVCSRLFGWVGFAGAMIGQILFMILSANGVV